MLLLCVDCVWCACWFSDLGVCVWLFGVHYMMWFVNRWFFDVDDELCWLLWVILWFGVCMWVRFVLLNVWCVVDFVMCCFLMLLLFVCCVCLMDCLCDVSLLWLDVWLLCVLLLCLLTRWVWLLFVCCVVWFMFVIILWLYEWFLSTSVCCMICVMLLMLWSDLLCVVLCDYVWMLSWLSVVFVCVWIVCCVLWWCGCVCCFVLCCLMRYEWSLLYYELNRFDVCVIVLWLIELCGVYFGCVGWWMSVFVVVCHWWFALLWWLCLSVLCICYCFVIVWSDVCMWLCCDCCVCVVCSCLCFPALLCNVVCVCGIFVWAVMLVFAGVWCV